MIGAIIAIIQTYLSFNWTLVRIPKAKLEKAQKNINSIDKELGKDKQIRIAILAKLLKKELDND